MDTFLLQQYNQKRQQPPSYIRTYQTQAVHTVLTIVGGVDEEGDVLVEGILLTSVVDAVSA